MTRSYQIVPPPVSSPTLDPKQLAKLLAKDGQLILPLLGLLENAQCALDDSIDVVGLATIEGVFRMSAETIARPMRQGKKSGRDTRIVAVDDEDVRPVTGDQAAQDGGCQLVTRPDAVSGPDDV